MNVTCSMCVAVDVVATVAREEGGPEAEVFGDPKRTVVSGCAFPESTEI
jgi:hypothetical protein